MQRRGIFAQERNNPSPGLHRESITRGESRQELDEKDQTFTRQVASCFGAIKRVEDKAAENKAARYQAFKDKAVENLSRRSTGTSQIVVFTPMRHVDPSYCNHRRCSSWNVLGTSSALSGYWSRTVAQPAYRALDGPLVWGWLGCDGLV